jgi:hypothetical protein
VGTFLSAVDLEPFASIDATKLSAMVDDAEAMAVLAAPCLSTPADLSRLQIAGVRAILRGAILRWHEAGSGALQQQSQSVGVFARSESFDNRQQRRGMFWPSEISQLQDICGKTTTSSGAFAIDTAPGSLAVSHSDICSVNFGAYCSCGAVLTGADPLYEV